MRVVDVLPGLHHFGVNFRERRDLRIPFQQGRNAAGQRVSQTIQFPNRVDYLATRGVSRARLYESPSLRIASA